MSGKPHEKRPLERARGRRHDNIKTHVTKYGYINWIEMAHNMIHGGLL